MTQVRRSRTRGDEGGGRSEFGPPRRVKVVRRPKLAIWKFASCDGCQLSLLNCEEDLLAIAEVVRIAEFREASRSVLKGPYDLSLVEGSITTAADAARIKEIRASSRRVVTIGACATAGGIQALRNFADVGDFIRTVYAEPGYIDTLATSTPIADHVPVDFELRGCPVDTAQLREVIVAFLQGRRPRTSAESVCLECKRAGRVCVTVAHGTPCLGPLTHTGCGALCPTFGRGCYGCFGPMETPNVPAWGKWWGAHGMSERDRVRALATFNVNAPEFRRAVTQDGEAND